MVDALGEHERLDMMSINVSELIQNSGCHHYLRAELNLEPRLVLIESIRSVVHPQAP